jgi:hypothetical protein
MRAMAVAGAFAPFTAIANMRNGAASHVGAVILERGKGFDRSHFVVVWNEATLFKLTRSWRRHDPGPQRTQQGHKKHKVDFDFARVLSLQALRVFVTYL